MPHMWKETKDALAAVIPELYEDEDEKIRKELIDFIYWETEHGSMTKEQLEKTNSWLMYLNKKKKTEEPVESAEVDREDSPYYDDICEILINLMHQHNGINKDAIQKDLNWFTANYHRTWRPTEKQLARLKIIKTQLIGEGKDYWAQILDEFIEEIEKL